MKKGVSQKCQRVSLYMTVFIVLYHIAPHLVSAEQHPIAHRLFDSLAGISLCYFFAQSAYFFCISKKTYWQKMKSRLVTLVIPFVFWNSFYLLFEVVRQNVSFDFGKMILGYTFEPFDGPLWYIWALILLFFVSPLFVKAVGEKKSRGLFIIAAVLLISFLFTHLFSKGSVNFAGAYWVERILRFFPAYMLGVHIAVCEIHIQPNIKIGLGGLFIGFVLIIVTDTPVASIILSYILMISIWLLCMEEKKICWNTNTFLIYASHDFLIKIVLVILAKTGISFGNYMEIVATFLIAIGIFSCCGLVNLVYTRLPLQLRVLICGGR